MEKYIPLNALVAEIERRIKNLYPRGGQGLVVTKILKDHYEDLLLFIDSLEVKEVGFERELSKYLSEGIHRFFPNETNNYYTMDSVIWQDYVIETAKHFFELGLKAQKGE